MQAGQRACVLAPGDAFREPSGSVFAAALAAHGLHFEIIPGIATS
jgi:siroheme synthase